LSSYESADLLSTSIYATLYDLPVQCILHVVFGGLLYYIYPYVLLLLYLVAVTAMMIKSSSWVFSREYLASKVCGIRSVH
jgi:hypothetical protein